MGFPFEIITMLASTVLGGVMSIWAESRKAKAENEKRQAMRKKTSSESNITMVEEYMGPVLSQLSDL